MGQRGNLRALVGDMSISLKLFLGTSAHFNRLFETSSCSRATASKQTKQNSVMATVEY